MQPLNIPFADLEALVDSAIQMEGKLNQANENRKRRMMHQSGPSNAPKYRPTKRRFHSEEQQQAPYAELAPRLSNRGRKRPGGHTNNYNNNNNFNRAPPRAPNNNNNTNTAQGPEATPFLVATKDKSTITCYECGVVGHYSNECPKRLAKLAATPLHLRSSNAAFPLERSSPNNPNNRNGRLFHMNAEEAQKHQMLYWEVGFLGHILSAGGIAVDPAKIKTVAEWKAPTTQTEIKEAQGNASIDGIKTQIVAGKHQDSPLMKPEFFGTKDVSAPSDSDLKQVILGKPMTPYTLFTPRYQDVPGFEGTILVAWNEEGDRKLHRQV
ncbi:hypothetical protein QYE76_048278 [Lolium multiflorum]|uniref:CCHC-type domain-containing protein n=1 Tax=Lolium multiflorum TaxID=4521 RepID=A0AAD8QFV4_LOLMU|nr:hypothetical protein QYE76_048278 [Lolium multiflorum]